MKKLTSILALLLTCGVQAEDIAYAPPLGGTNVTITGAAAGVPKVTTVSPALRLSLGQAFVGRGRGTLTAVAATSFSDSAAGWTGGALSQAAVPYFVRIRSGAGAGTWWQISTSAANTSTTATILNRGVSPVSLGIAAGDAYEIVPGDTLATLLGDIAASVGGPNAGAADAVRVHDGTSWREYYYNTTVSQWREGASTFNRSNTIIRPETGVVIVRRAAGNLNLTMLGVVSDANEKVAVNSTGATVVGSVFPITRTLGSLNIQNMPGFVNYTGNLPAADKVTFYDGVTWRTFQYNSSVSQWREGLSTFNRNNLALPFGAPVILERGSGATGGIVQLTLQIPYSL
jgi:hypothetical protein